MQCDNAMWQTIFFVASFSARSAPKVTWRWFCHRKPIGFPAAIRWQQKWHDGLHDVGWTSRIWRMILDDSWLILGWFIDGLRCFGWCWANGGFAWFALIILKARHFGCLKTPGVGVASVSPNSQHRPVWLWALKARAADAMVPNLSQTTSGQEPHP